MLQLKFYAHIFCERIDVSNKKLRKINLTKQKACLSFLTSLFTHDFLKRINRMDCKCSSSHFFLLCNVSNVTSFVNRKKAKNHENFLINFQPICICEKKTVFCC